MANNGIAKNQHYVPQFLLKNFVFKKDQVNVFDKKADRSFQTNTKNVASENGFYNFTLPDGTEHTWEVALSGLEAKASVIVKQILNDKSLKNLSGDQRWVLSFFLAIQLVRTRHSREYFKDMVIKFSDEVNGRFGNQHDLFTDDEVKKLVSDDHLKRYTAESLYEAKDLYLPYFLHKHWALFEAPKGETFYIGDNPVSKFNQVPGRFGKGNVGLGVKGVEVYLPISNKMTIAFLCPILLDEVIEKVQKAKGVYAFMLDTNSDSYKEAIEAEKYLCELLSEDAQQIQPENVRHLNSLQVSHSDRYVFSSKKDFELVEEMIGKDDRYRRGPRIEIS